VNDTDRAIRQAQPERAAFVEAVEQALAFGRDERRSGRMRGGQPGGAGGGDASFAPLGEPLGESSGETLEESAGQWQLDGQRCEARRFLRQPFGMMSEVDAEAGDHRVALALKQDAGELGAANQKIVGPFDADSRYIRCDDVMERDGGDECQRRSRRVSGAKADDRAGVEVTRRGEPRPALPALAASLAIGAQPAAFGRTIASENGEIVVGGACLCDGADQNSELAADIVAWPSTGIIK